MLIGMGGIFEFQRWLYSAAIEALNGLRTAGLAGLPGLIGAAFGFGMVTLRRSPATASRCSPLTMPAMDDCRSARVQHDFDSYTYRVRRRARSRWFRHSATDDRRGRPCPGAGVCEPGADRAVGLRLLWRAFRPHSHNHNRSGAALAVVTGMVPCPLTTFIMTYAVANGVVAAGLILSGTFAAGMVVTVAAFPLLTVLLRTRLLPMMAQSEGWRQKIGHLLEVTAAIAVIALGLWPLLQGRLLAGI